MNPKVLALFVSSLILVSLAYGDEFDDSLSNQVLGEESLGVNHKNEIESATVVPEQVNSTSGDTEYEKTTESPELHEFSQSPEIDEEGEGEEAEAQPEKATWHINQYMHGCDHDVRDCFDAAIQLNNPEGKDKDTLMFDCIEAHDCEPLKRWACDSNLKFINRHTLLTDRCVNWGLYQYQDDETTEQSQQEVDREL